MIKVGEDYRIGSTPLNVIIYEKHISKKGKEVWEEKLYFATVQDALKELVNLNVRKTGLKDMGIVCNKIDELYKLIESLPETLRGV